MADEAERHVRPFAEWLIEQRGGALAGELGRALNEVVEAVVATNKVGKLRLELTVKPLKQTGALVVLDDVVTKVPKPDRGEAVFFADDDHNLTRRDPRQPELPGLRGVPAPADAKEA